MFTGIIETTGNITAIEEWGSNRSFWIRSGISNELTVDQSVSHSGVCLTVEEIKNDVHKVTAIAETLQKTNLQDWEPATMVNIERCVPVNGRLDGHIVQGHVDTVATCLSVSDQNGSWLYQFKFEPAFAYLLIEKGSICINGISLTAFDVGKDVFSVAVIPYTFHHTNIQKVQTGGIVNIEFDILGKYISRWRELLQ